MATQATYTLQVSESLYQRLREKANALHLTPEQLIERLLLPETLALIAAAVEQAEEPMPPPNSDAALAALHRLTTCFADVTIPNLEAVLADPLMELVNVDLDAL